MDSWLDSGAEAAVTSVVCVLSIAAVLLPLARGLVVCGRAWSATRRTSRAALERGLEAAAPDASLARLLARVLAKSLREAGGAHPRDFVVDASRQYVMNEYDAHYARVISMYANLLPPIGFIGTTVGLLMLFLSMHLSNAALELGALAVALLSSIFALIGFAVLEGIKIRLYARLLACIDDVLALERAAGSAAQRAPAPQPG